ncbi:hypothetical protein [Haloparvum sp. PAK95]|uniref:hypothetical protein n=1 Tax=Haloparvum sp. PAK95 TaxID=3418962 RepID=UPI003D2EC617
MTDDSEPSGSGADEPADAVSVEETQLPIDGTALVKAGAVASVPLSRLPELLYRVQAHLRDRIDEYRRSYERIHAADEREAFLVEDGHWDDVGDELGLAEREADAVRRAHEAQVERFGSSENRREEVETALEIRTAVVVGVAEA